ncbi:MAG: RNA polymerase sigma factor [Streptosporangiaceae bacterium]
MSDSASQLAADHLAREAMNDAELISRSRRVPECFALLFDRHATALYRYVARRLGRDTCDDLVAETFTIAFRRRDSYDAAHADARPWLYGIATKLIWRHRRDEVRYLQAIARLKVNPARAHRGRDNRQAYRASIARHARVGSRPVARTPARRAAAGRQRAQS